MSSPVTYLTDFSDRISPMLVKELRQGLRAKTFIVVFLSLQVFLMVMLLAAGAASTSDHVGSVISGVIFSFFAIAVLIVQPLRGTNALSSEIKGNTIDMMVLTRLSAWRIVFGKWVAIVSQSALLLATIIPYLILRYFFGGMNLVAEMIILFLLFLTSMALTAFTIGISGCSSIIIRSLVPIAGLPVLLYMLGAMSFSRMGGSFMDAFALDSTESRIGVASYIVALLYIGGSMLSLGASLIAPASENHSIVRRLVALTAIIILCGLALFYNTDETWMLMLVFIISFPAIIIALTENAPLVETVTQPFARFGTFGKTIGCFLYPTWSSGVLYTILLAFVSICTLFAHDSVDWHDEQGVVFLSLFGGLLFPAAWQAFLFKGEGQRIANYLLILLGSIVMLGILSILTESMNNGDFLWCFAWNPLAFLPMLSESSVSDEVLFGGALVVDLLLGTLLVSRAMLAFNKPQITLDSSTPAEQTAAIEETKH